MCGRWFASRASCRRYLKGSSAIKSLLLADGDHLGKLVGELGRATASLR